MATPCSGPSVRALRSAGLDRLQALQRRHQGLRRLLTQQLQPSPQQFTLLGRAAQLQSSGLEGGHQSEVIFRHCEAVSDKSNLGRLGRLGRLRRFGGLPGRRNGRLWRGRRSAGRLCSLCCRLSGASQGALPGRRLHHRSGRRAGTPLRLHRTSSRCGAFCGWGSGGSGCLLHEHSRNRWVWKLFIQFMSVLISREDPTHDLPLQADALRSSTPPGQRPALSARMSA